MGMAAPGVVAPGEAAAMVVAVVTVGVAAPTTAAKGTAAAEAEEARLVVVETREAVRSLDVIAGAVAAALGRPRWTTGRREGPFHWLQFLFQPVLGFKLGPRRGHCGDQKKASDSFLGGCCIFSRKTQQTYFIRRPRHACVLAFSSRPYCHDRYRRCCC